MIEQSLRVLVIDDEALARQRLCSLLARVADVEVVGECQNGLEAVAAIRANQPDLVFLDVHMPELGGFEVLKEVRCARMPAIVFMSGNEHFAAKAFEVQATDYLVKPCGRHRLQTCLQRVRSQCARVWE